MIKPAVTSSKPAWRWLQEVYVLFRMLCRHTKRMVPAQRGEGGVVVERYASSSDWRDSGKPLHEPASLSRVKLA